MLLQVHDELLFEVPDRRSSRRPRSPARVMEGAPPELSVPLVVETGIGANWALRALSTAKPCHPERSEGSLRPQKRSLASLRMTIFAKCRDGLRGVR